jgi:RNA polymerase sigma factor (TIGR02999 family)
MADITDLLNRWSDGDQQAFEDMVPLMYDDLKRVAQRSLQNERHAPTLNTTALVHEAYLRLVNQNQVRWNGKAHFLGAAANAMRRLLVEHARKRLSEKRGAGAPHEGLDREIAVALEPDIDVIQLDSALDELATGDPESAKVVELRCFGGLSLEETAEVMGISVSSVARIWSFARAARRWQRGTSGGAKRDRAPGGLTGGPGTIREACACL